MEGNRARMSINKVAALRGTELFRSLPDDLLKKIAGRTIVRQLKRGQTLYSEHEEAAGLYVVVKGEIRSIRKSAEGREQVLCTEQSGGILAAVPVFDAGKFYSTMIADSASEVLFVEKQHIRELCREHTEMLWNIATILAREVRQHAELIETLALQNVDQRVAQYLLSVAQPRGIGVGEGCLIELTLTRSEIASRLGSVREVVSRSLAHLQKSDLIHMQGRRLIHIPDLRKLSGFASMDRSMEGTKPASDLPAEVA